MAIQAAFRGRRGRREASRARLACTSERSAKLYDDAGRYAERRSAMEEDARLYHRRQWLRRAPPECRSSRLLFRRRPLGEQESFKGQVSTRQHQPAKRHPGARHSRPQRVERRRRRT